MASASQLKRMSTRSQPRTTRYRYVVNDLPPPPPPVLPPLDSELPPVPPVIRPARPARSGSRPTPTPSRAASPIPVTLPLNVPSAGPKQTRRRSRSLGSLPPPPPYAVEDSPASARGRAGAPVTVPADPAVVLDLKDKSMRTLRRMSRSLTQLRSRAQSTERGPPPSTAQKPLVTVIPPVPVRAQSSDRGPPPSSAYKPLVTVIPPMPDRAPPLPSDEAMSSTTPIARPVPSSKAEASLGRAPPTIRNTGAAAPPDQMANPRPAPKPPSTNIDPPMPLAARDDSAVREQVQGIKLRRISRSYTNLRLMATPDSLQAEQQTNRALQLQADKDAQLNRARSLSPRPLPTLPQQNKEQVTASTSSQVAKAAPAHPAQPARRVLPAPPSTPPSGPLPTPPPPPPAPASVGEQPTPASRKGRGILATSAARLKAMSPMAMMSSFAPSRPSSRDSTSSRTTTASSHSHSHSYSSHTTASVSSHTTASSSSHSHSHSYSHSPSSRAPPLAPFANVNRSRSGSAASASRLVIPIPRMRSRALPPPEVYTPVDPVVAPNNRISFLKPAMVKPYMGQRF